jgi:SAM-dependent methyltransferase
MSERDRDHMREFYDELGEAEWTRLEASPRGRVSFEVHRRFLSRFVANGDQVLEIGAGPGRFTFELASLGAIVDVTDVSNVQLELNREHLTGTTAETSVRSRELVDICDTTGYPDASFDVVLAFGGPLSYAFEEAESALRGLLRIIKPGGFVVASVMSWLGSWRYFLRGVLDDEWRVGEEAGDLAMTTGDLRHVQTDHICQMFRSSDIETLASSCDAELVAMSASNWASLGPEDVLMDIESDARRWDRFLTNEVAACAERGALDGGTHILFALRKG